MWLFISFIKTFLGKIDVKLLLIVIGILAILGSGWFLYSAGRSAERQKIKQEQLVEIKEDFKKYKENVVVVDSINNLQAATVETQIIIKEKIRNVPVIAEDRPFVNDPALHDRVDIMRTFQEEYTNDK